MIYVNVNVGEGLKDIRARKKDKRIGGYAFEFAGLYGEIC